MDENAKTYKEMNKKKYELDEKLVELEKAKDDYAKTMVTGTINDILTVFKDDGKITERDLQIFLTDLANNVKNVYYR